MTQDGRETSALQALADKIKAVLTRGLAQDQATLDMVLVALGETEARTALDLLAADPEASEHAALLALLLSPDTALRRELEPALCQAELDAAGAEALADLVAEMLPTGQGRGQGSVPILLPDGSRAELAATPDGLRAFVRRLRPEATAPAELRGIIARNIHARDIHARNNHARPCTPELGADLGVVLRHCRLAWTPGQVFFLGTLLERAEPSADDLPGLLAWAAGYLEDVGPEQELRRGLAARRHALQSQLRQAEFMEEALARGSYETLMSQGLRFAHVHGPDVRTQLAFLERAAKLALGLAGEALDGVSVRDLGQAEDAEELLRLLPGFED
ncbi:MAG: hypothetical protein KKF77_08075 [Proteobacteria bacterium]|nr:hypothetical protein [Pseudomonadota bacterium]